MQMLLHALAVSAALPEVGVQSRHHQQLIVGQVLLLCLLRLNFDNICAFIPVCEGVSVQCRRHKRTAPVPIKWSAFPVLALLMISGKAA